MVAILGLLAVAGFIFALVNLARPLGRLGITTRRRAGALLGASFLVFSIAVIASPSPEEGTSVEASADSTSTTLVTTTSEQPTTTTTRPTTTAPLPTTTAPQPTTTQSIDLSAIMGDLFVLLVRDVSADLPYNWTDEWTDDELVRVVTDVVCDNFDDGFDFATTALIMASVLAEDGWDSETDIEMLGYVIGAGTEAFCPEYSHLIEDFGG